MQKAVKIVPKLTKALMLLAAPPPIKNIPMPAKMQRQSEIIRTVRNFPSFHLFEQISAIASYVETPISAVIYRDEPKQRRIKPKRKQTTRKETVGEGKSKIIKFCENSTT